jgi:2-polyprenyl-3-methyl-5-hydroxy-6-metoxy-1,4-benzoquinol methylase
MADGGSDYKRDWERLARVDAEWAIVSRAGRRRRDGTPWTRTEFLATGDSDAMEILERLGMASVDGLRVLEVGCGAGRLLRAFAQRGAVVTGVDVSPRMLELAAQNCSDFRNSVSFLNGDGETLKGLSAETFDVVYTWHVLQHVPDENVVLRLIGEIHRVLKPGARVLLHIPERSRRNLRWRAYRLLTRLGLAIDPTGPLSAIPMFGIPREKVIGRLGELGFASLESQASGMSTCYVVRK